jgi:hypothetical protein
MLEGNFRESVTPMTGEARDSFNNASEPLFGPPPRHERPRSNVRWIVGGVAAIAGAVCLVCCGAGVWFFSSMAAEVPVATAAADEFLDDLKAQRIDEAYSRTTTAFQNASTIENFRGLLQAAPIVTGHTTRQVQLSRIFKNTNGSIATFRVTFTSQDSSGGATLTMAKEDDQWKVMGLNIDAAAIQAPADSEKPSTAEN